MQSFLSVFVGGTVFAAGGLLMISLGAPRGWAVLLFSGSGAVLAAAFLRPDLSGFGQSDSRSVEEVLSRFPGRLSFRSSRRKSLLLLVVSLAWIATAVILIASGGTDPYQGMRGTFIGWLSFPFFAFLTAVAVVRSLPGSIGLVLDDEGFDSIKFFRRRRTRWQDVSAFEVAKVHHHTKVVRVFPQQKDGRLAKTREYLVGRNTSLPDNFGFSHENLAALMNQWRERALARLGGTTSTR